MVNVSYEAWESGKFVVSLPGFKQLHAETVCSDLMRIAQNFEYH